jgi:hypothetical protein
MGYSGFREWGTVFNFCLLKGDIFAKFPYQVQVKSSCTALAVPYLNSIEGKKELFHQECV